VHPTLFRIPLGGGRHFDIASYGVMMALGTIFALFAALRLAKKDRVSADTVVDAAFWSVLGGVVGAKLWYVIQYWSHYEDKWELAKSFRSGLVWYGGVIGGALCLLFYLRRKRQPILTVLDICTPAAALGLAFGRIGCFLNGCCYGEETSGPLGVCFHHDSPAFHEQLAKGLIAAGQTASNPVYPTQLFESTGALLIFATILLLRRTRRFFGEQTALFFVLYGVLRFNIEWFRGDHERELAGLTAAQVFSILIVTTGAAVFVYLRTARPKKLSVKGAGDAADKAHPRNKGPAK
jgi:phosphatidylglycerol:prolipoprotein diacylglycerol transferase